MRISLLIILACFSNILFAIEQTDIDYAAYQTVKSAAPSTSKLVLKESNHDLGSIDFGTEQVYHFEFMNHGPATLVIEEIFAKGDLASVISYTPRIEQGETGKIRVKFESGLEIGKFSEWFFIRSNSEGKKTLTRLEIKYELSEYLAIGGDNVGAQDKVNIRKLPRLDSPVVAQLERGDSCKILGDDIGDYVEKFDDSYWFKIDAEGQEGWVLSALTEF